MEFIRFGLVDDTTAGFQKGSLLHRQLACCTRAFPFQTNSPPIAIAAKYPQHLAPKTLHAFLAISNALWVSYFVVPFLDQHADRFMNHPVEILSLLVLPAWFAAFLMSRMTFQDWREAALSACVVWGIIVVVLTEALSIFRAMAFLPLVIAWAVISCSSVVIIARLWPGCLMMLGISIRGPFRRKHIIPAMLLSGMSFLFLATFVVVIVSPPNNWDSMTYHMARVANWIDHRSVRDYPAHTLRQLWLGPWAEFAIMHLQILAGEDRFANCVQFVSMLGSVVGTSLLAKKLGAEYRGQLIASVFCATIPVGLLEASTTQNDYVTAFWLLCFLNFTIDSILGKSPVSSCRTVLAGMSLGLALLTKMTALIFAAPFLLWACLLLLRNRVSAAAYFLTALTSLALIINAGHLTRNESAFGSPLGPPTETATLRNEIHTPAAMTSNIIRNLAVHLGSVPKFGTRIKAGVIRIHRLAGVDPDDPRLSWHVPFSSDQCVMTLVLGPCFTEDYVGNPLHLMIAGLAILITFWRVRRNRLPAIYCACIAGGFLLFCGYLKWQPWVSRLHLPLFVAVAPVCGLVLSRGRFRQVGYALSTVMLCAGVLYVAKSYRRSLVWRSSIFLQSRTDMYFAARPELRQPYYAAVAEVARGNPSVIGIITLSDDYEYPLWVLVRMRLGSNVKFEHFNVRNESRDCLPDIPPNGALPDKIIVTGSFRDSETRPSLPDDIPTDYRPAFASKPIRVFERFPRAAVSR